VKLNCHRSVLGVRKFPDGRRTDPARTSGEWGLHRTAQDEVRSTSRDFVVCEKRSSFGGVSQFTSNLCARFWHLRAIQRLFEAPECGPSRPFFYFRSQPPARVERQRQPDRRRLASSLDGVTVEANEMNPLLREGFLSSAYRALKRGCPLRPGLNHSDSRSVLRVSAEAV